MTERTRRLAHEAQLLAEERWIIDAIKRIRTQRNCLQIERLQLESMLAEAKNGPVSSNPENTANTAESTQPSTSAMAEVSQIPTLEFTEVQYRPTIMNDDLCNFEELNLNVTNPMPMSHNDIEEEEEDDDDDQENMMLDINMLMQIQ